MKRRVYIETSVASYLTARPSRDLVVAAHQGLTAEWWMNHRRRFEAAKGDESAASKRLAELQGIEVLALDDYARDLARVFVGQKLNPEKAVEDAFHVGPCHLYLDGSVLGARQCGRILGKRSISARRRRTGSRQQRRCAPHSPNGQALGETPQDRPVTIAE